MYSPSLDGAMLREALLALILTSVALAGCLQAPPEDVTAASASETSPLLAEAGAISSDVAAANATNASAWWMLTVDASPEGGLASAWWTVPEGAVVPWAYNDNFDMDETTVALEVALVVPEGKAGLVEAWALHAFSLEEGALWPVGEIGESTWDAKPHGLLPTGVEGYAPELEPRFMRLGMGRLADGDRVGFVLAARAPEPVELGLAFRVLDHDPEHGEDPAGSWSKFRDARGAVPPVALARAGEGQGYATAAYVEFNSFRPPFGIYAYSATTGEVSVEGGVSPDLRPLGGHRQMRVSAASPTASGWTAGMAGHISSGDGASEWSGRVSHRGEELAASGVVAGPRDARIASWILFGFPVVGGLAEGEGVSETELSLDVVGVNQWESVLLYQDDLGATLSDLLGEPAGADAYAFDGLLGQARGGLVGLHGDDLVVVGHDGSVRVLGGALAGLPDEARAAFA